MISGRKPSARMLVSISIFRGLSAITRSCCPGHRIIHRPTRIPLPPQPVLAIWYPAGTVLKLNAAHVASPSPVAPVAAAIFTPGVRSRSASHRLNASIVNVTPSVLESYLGCSLT